MEEELKLVAEVAVEAVEERVEDVQEDLLPPPTYCN